MPKKPKPPKTLKTRVTSISVGATFNLGNYENVRYDVSAEVGPGESAMAAFQELRFIIASLKPIRSPGCLEEYEKARKKEHAEMSNWEQQQFESWAATVADWELRKTNRAQAIQALDRLGRNQKFRDAKQSRETDDTPF